MKKHKTLIGWLIVLALLILIMIISMATKGWNGKGIVFFFKVILLDNFLAVNPLLLGTMTFIGYLVMKRGIRDSLIGAVKTAIGVLILTIGAGMLVGMAKPIFAGVSKIGGDAKVVPLDPYLGWASSNSFLKQGIDAATSYISWVSYALLIGFAFNIILVLLKRFTNVHTLMVTGHIMFQQTAILTVMIYVLMFRGVDSFVAREVGTILVTGILIGTYWGVASGTSLKATQKVTNKAGFALGHQQMFGAAIAYKMGRFFGKKEDSAETKKLSPKFKIFEDNLFTQTIILLILFFTLIMLIEFASPGATHAFSSGMGKKGVYHSWAVAGGAYWVLNIFLGSLKLTASILVIITGVRMFVTELQQAFQGISQKIIPGAVVAVDCAATYGFSPNSVTYGFVSGVIGQFLAVGIIVGLSTISKGGMVIVVPLFITLFFNSGTMGVYANASGGWKASIIVPMILGFVELFVASGAIAMISNGFDSAVKDGSALASHVVKGKAISNSPVASGYIGMIDWNLIWGAQILATGGKVAGAAIVFPLSFIGMLLIAQITDNTMQHKKTLLQKVLKLSITNESGENDQNEEESFENEEDTKSGQKKDSRKKETELATE